MSSNEPKSTNLQNHLLEWVNTTLSDQPACHTFAQILQRGHIVSILASTDSSFFGRLPKIKNLTFANILAAIQLHMQTILGKTIRKKYYLEVATDEDVGALLGLVLYECVNCSQKEQLIIDILSLPPQTQECLMEVIELASSHIENTMEIRQILDKVNQLQLLNDQLKATIVQQQAHASELAQRLDFIMADFRELEEQCDNYRRQKSQTARELGLQNFGEYLYMFKSLQLQNDKLIRMLDEADGRIEQLERDNQSYKARIIQDNHAISDLGQQLSRFKSMCKTLRISNSFSFLDLQTTQDSTTQLSIDGSFLKQNRILTNINLDSSTTSIKIRCKQNSEDVYLSEPYLKLQYEYHKSISRCQSLEAMYEDHKAKVIELSSANAQLSSDNQFLKEQIQVLRGLHAGLRRLIS